jgi:hypothetical protein
MVFQSPFVVRKFFINQWVVLVLCCVLGAWLVMISLLTQTLDKPTTSGESLHILVVIFFGHFAFFRHPSFWFLLYLGYGMMNAFAQYKPLLVALTIHNLVWLVVVLFQAFLPFELLQKKVSVSLSASDVFLYYVGNSIVFFAVMALLLFNIFSGIALKSPKT